MADQDRYPPAHGDEAELFRAFNDELMRTVGSAVRWTTPHVIEDSCAFAWSKFLQCQPRPRQELAGVARQDRAAGGVGAGGSPAERELRRRGRDGPRLREGARY